MMFSVVTELEKVDREDFLTEERQTRGHEY